MLEISRAPAVNVISLFSGCGGLDLGFKKAGFNIIFANDIEKRCWETYEKNLGHPIDGRSIVEIPSSEFPDADGIIGGPPCQSWSLAGEMRGIDDKRGRLFYEYIRILQDKKPKFFVAENVPGILSRTHIGEFERILQEFAKWGYKIKYQLLDARDYGVPQERKRVFIVGIRADLKQEFNFPIALYTQNPANSSSQQWRTLRETLSGLPDARPALEKNYANHASDLSFPNHEYAIGGFSSIFMSRNRVKRWDEASFTIQASGRHAPLHPDSSKMRKVEKDRWEFIGDNPQYRRLSVRECARIQTFPDDFIFYYRKLEDAYRMIGNAVPVKLAKAIGIQILNQLNHGVKK